MFNELESSYYLKIIRNFSYITIVIMGVNGVKNTEELVIILAAGMGSRLRPFTDELPKCLVPVNGTPLLSLSIAQMKKAGLKNFLIVGGYRRETLEEKGYNVVPNLEFQNSNMVWSLTQAIEHIDNASCEYVVIHYGDILVSYKNILSLRKF